MEDSRDTLLVENSISDIRRFFEEGASPLHPSEFTEFWKSLNEEEKIEFKNMDLTVGGTSP